MKIQIFYYCLIGTPFYLILSNLCSSSSVPSLLEEELLPLPVAWGDTNLEIIEKSMNNFVPSPYNIRPTNPVQKSILFHIRPKLALI